MQVNSLGYLKETLGPMIDGIHRGHDSEKHLRGTDVARRLFTANVLLAGLECEAVGWIFISITGDANETARQSALELISHSHIARVRPTISHRHTKALRGTNDNVCSEFTRRLEQHKCQWVTRHHRESTRRMNLLHKRCWITDHTIGGRILENTATESRTGDLINAADYQFNAKRLSASLKQGQYLGMTALRDKEPGDPPEIMAHCQRLGCRRGLIQHGGIGNRHSGEVTNHRLEIHECLHTPL